MQPSGLRNSVRRLLARFFTNRRASVAVTFALASIPIVAAVGAAVDFSLVSRASAKLNEVLFDMNKEISNPGDGSKISRPQKYLFFVTDGVADAYYPTTCSQPTTGGRCQEPLTVANCTTMKNRGIKIAVLYTTYEPLPTNAWYTQWIAPFNPGPWGPSPNSQIAIILQQCASPGLYFEVSPTQGISDAMNALFQKTVAEARITK